MWLYNALNKDVSTRNLTKLTGVIYHVVSLNTANFQCGIIYIRKQRKGNIFICSIKNILTSGYFELV